MPVQSPITWVSMQLPNGSVAALKMKQILTSNTAENKAVKIAKGYQHQITDTTLDVKTRISYAQSANKNWTDALKAADKTNGLINALWKYAYNSGGDLTPYPVVSIPSWSGIAGQNKLYNGATAIQRISGYAGILTANKQIIKNLTAILNFHIVPRTPEQSAGITDLNGAINVNTVSVSDTVNQSPTIDPNSPNVAVPGAAEETDPATGVVVDSDGNAVVPANEGRTGYIAAGVAALLGLGWLLTRKG